MKTQIGISEGANFEENTWTFQMPEGFVVKAGEFSIVPSQTICDILSKANRVLDAIGNNADLQFVKDDMRFILDEL